MVPRYTGNPVELEKCNGCSRIQLFPFIQTCPIRSLMISSQLRLHVAKVCSLSEILHIHLHYSRNRLESYLNLLRKPWKTQSGFHVIVSSKENPAEAWTYYAIQPRGQTIWRGSIYQWMCMVLRIKTPFFNLFTKLVFNLPRHFHSSFTAYLDFFS